MMFNNRLPRRNVATWILFGFLAPFAARAAAVTVNPAEMTAASAWFADHFRTDGTAIPFSFRYAGKPSSSFLHHWTRTATRVELGPHRVQHTLAYADPRTGLSVRCEAVEYLDYPTLEWTVRFENRSRAVAPLIEAVRALDSVFSVRGSEGSVPVPRPHWNAATDWTAPGSSRKSDWRCVHGWIAGWKPFQTYDRDTYLGLERWRQNAGGPWIGKNTTAHSVPVGAARVPPRAVVIQPAAGTRRAGPAPGSCAGLVWQCPATGVYRLEGRLHNLGAEGDGIEWVLHDWDWNVLAHGVIAARGKDHLRLDRQMIAAGQQICLTANARGNPRGDLTQIDLDVFKLSDPKPGDVILRFARGSEALVTDYEPVAWGLGRSATYRLAPKGGRPSCGLFFPYFNLGWQDRGCILAVGWPGQWQAVFTRQEDRLFIHAGQQRTGFRLQPGESARTPLIVLQFYHGHWRRAQNVWRRWMLDHNVPRPGGKRLGPELAACSSGQFREMLDANEQNQILFIDRYLAERFPLDFWWMDAGWYVNSGDWVNTGTWQVDRKRFPHGLRAITDHAHAKGVKCIVWFEPERVTPGTWLYQRHPEWLLRPANLPPGLAYQAPWRLLNLGDTAAQRWLVHHIDHLLTSQKIDFYRQDFNMDPLYFWNAHDRADRQGLTENHHVAGYLAFWDALRRRHPRLLIDSCASGGRRNDLETLRRSVPLLRSDKIFEPVSQQCHTYGLASWLPFYGTGTRLASPTSGSSAERNTVYAFRSQMCPHLTACWDMRRTDTNYDLLRRLVREWRCVAPYYFGDYYPLTAYSTAMDVWMAWQFDRPDLGGGLVQAFRRAGSSDAQRRVHLLGLDADAWYALRNFDHAAKPPVQSGRQLLREGLTIVVKDPPGSALITYQKVRAPK